MTATRPDYERAREELLPWVVGRHTDLAWRHEQLEILRSAIGEEKEAMRAAIKQDLCVDGEQATLLQISALYGEIDVCIDNMDKWAAVRKVPTPLPLQPATSRVQAQPKGVVLVIGAWNYPFNVTIGPVACAIAAGNCVVAKPSEHAPESAKVLERIFARLDQRGVRCCCGGPEVSASLTSQPFDHIVFTGSPRVAKLIMAAAAPNLTPVTMELGGKCPVVLCQGVSLAESCQRILTHKFTNTGQTCIAPDYILVERSIRDEVASILAERVQAMFGGSPEKVEHFGRLVHQGAAERLMMALKEDHGGKVLVGGEKPEGDFHESHRYVPPTVILDPRKRSLLMTEEIFGPILPVLTVESCDEAIEFINNRPKPLALYVFAPQDMTDRVIEHTSSGSVVAGDAILHKGNPNLPFGGIGNSGMGRIHGEYGFRELSNERAVMFRPLIVPSALTLPCNKGIVSIMYAYAAFRPGKGLRQHILKVIAIVVALLLWLRRARR